MLIAGPTVAHAEPASHICAWRQRLAAFMLAATTLCAGNTAAAQEARQLVPASGEPLLCGLKAIDDAWQIRYETADGPGTIAAADVAWWGAPAKLRSRRGVQPTDGAQVVLADGGVLAADVLAVAAGRVSLGSIAFDEFDLRLSHVRAILFRPPADIAQRDAWIARASETEHTADRLLLANGDILRGRLLGIKDGAISFDAGSGALPPIEAQRVAAVAFNPGTLRTTEPTGLRAWVGFTDGTRLLASSVLLDDEQVKVQSAAATFQTHPARLCWLQPLGGRVVYLSDLEAVGYRHIPFLTMEWPYQRDANVLGRPLRVAGQWYAKGIGMHSRSRLTYVLDGNYTEFAAEVALDEAAGPEGSAVCYVFVGRELKYRSPELRPGEEPVAVRVPIANAQSLTLVVDFAARGDVQDHVDWLNARLIRAK